MVDRYGNAYGRYVSPAGTPYEQRSLPYVENQKLYRRYKVRKTIHHMTEGKIAAAFYQVGGGIQYELPKSIRALLKSGHLEEVER